MKSKLFLLLFISCYLTTYAQQNETIALDLNQVIDLAKKKSLDAFRDKNRLQTKTWDFKNFEIQNLPVLSVNFNPLSYNRSMVQRYNSIENRDEYREIKTLNSYLGLNIKQNIIATGGSVFINSNINRFENKGENSSLAFNNNIIKLGFNQPIFAYNPYKWNKKIAPLDYQKAKKEYIESEQSLCIKAVNYFYALASAQLNLEISTNNYNNAKKIYDLGKERFKIATINQEELLNLELNVINSDVSLSRAQKQIQQARFWLNSFLGNEEGDMITLNISETIPNINIDSKWAIEKSKINNSETLNMKLKELRSLQQLSRTESESRFSPSISGSYGLNQSAGNYVDSYANPLAQHIFNVSLAIPIVDWGKRKRNNKVAKKNHEITMAENKQASKDFQQKVKMQTIDFNLQYKLVQSAAKASKIAVQSHDIILERFKFGNIDIVKLNATIAAKDRAKNSYLNSLKTFWVNYYTLQKLTLSDLKTANKLTIKFKAELN